MQKLHYNKNTHMHTAHTHTCTPQTELNHRSERDLRTASVSNYKKQVFDNVHPHDAGIWKIRGEIA